SNGKIIATGNNEEMQELFKANEVIDAEGKVVLPGFIDAHAHFMSYGQSLQELDLTDTKSWEQIIEKTEDYAESHPEGWVIGRGWDQNDWDFKGFPSKTELDSIFPNRPVLLTHIDGHAAIANQSA